MDTLRILVEEEDIVELVRYNLTADGYQTSSAGAISRYRFKENP